MADSAGRAVIACFGDSLTEGYGLAPEEALPAVLEALLAKDGLKTQCLNFGVSGDTAGDGLKRIRPVLEANPDAALVAFGANDGFVGDSIPTIRNNLSAIIEQLQATGCPILLVGITALPDLVGDDNAYRQAFDALFGELAKTYGLPLFPDILACYFGDNDRMLMDGTHPNAQGVQAIARGLLPQVKKLLRS